jgi:ferredoxin-NADP reductase
LTAPLLLGYICAALLAQLAMGIGLAVWRRARAPQGNGVPTAPSAEAAQGAWAGWRDFRVVRRVYEDEAHTQCSFHLEPLDGAPLPPFKPGQFLTLDLSPADQGEARTLTRCYSLSDQPEACGYRITVKRVPAPPDRPELPPGLASNHLHDRVQAGDVLKLRAPSGHFHIDAASGVPVVLVAGGIGITPMMSMLRWCLAEQPQRVIHLYYGLRHLGEQVFKAQLEQLASTCPNFHLYVVCSRPRPGDVPGRDYQHVGHVDLDLLRQSLPHGPHQFYLCGPPAMMESLVPALAAWGVPQPDIHFEAFGPASVRLPGAEVEPLAAPLEVKFRRSGRTLSWDGQDASLLDLAERCGLAVESGCRSGACGSCETRLLEGSVRYAQAPSRDVTPGHCLLCVAVPRSALALDA